MCMMWAILIILMNNHGIFHNFEIFEIMKVNVAWDRTSIKVHGDWRSQLKGRRWDEWVAERGNKKKKMRNQYKLHAISVENKMRLQSD